MSRKTRKQKLAADKRKLAVTVEPEATSSSPSFTFQAASVVNPHQTSQTSQVVSHSNPLLKDLSRTAVITLLAIVLQLCLYYLVKR